MCIELQAHQHPRPNFVVVENVVTHDAGVGVRISRQDKAIVKKCDSRLGKLVATGRLPFSRGHFWTLVFSYASRYAFYVGERNDFGLVFLLLDAFSYVALAVF